jgi:hypothetical protein
MQLLKALNTTILVVGIFLCLGGFIGFQIAFGHGLGDIVYYAILFPVTIIHLIWTIRIRKATHWAIFLIPLTIFSLTTLLFCLKATIWRGPEYSWDNGNLFYSNGGTDYAETQMMYEITIADKTDYVSVSDPKEKYESELKVTVDTQSREVAFIDSGVVVRPDTLMRYMHHVDDKKIIIEGRNPFTSDSALQTAYLVGQVSGVRNNKIIFYISSWETEKSGR